jgi:hypothetical protein
MDAKVKFFLIFMYFQRPKSTDSQSYDPGTIIAGAWIQSNPVSNENPIFNAIKNNASNADLQPVSIFNYATDN